MPDYDFFTEIIESVTQKLCKTRVYFKNAEVYRHQSNMHDHDCDDARKSSGSINCSALGPPLSFGNSDGEWSTLAQPSVHGLQLSGVNCTRVEEYKKQIQSQLIFVMTKT